MKNAVHTLSNLVFFFILLSYNSAKSQSPVLYTPFYTNTSLNAKQVDINLAVGATNGEAGVSNGAATYKIPIYLPPSLKSTTDISDINPRLGSCLTNQISLNKYK